MQPADEAVGLVEVPSQRGHVLALAKFGDAVGCVVPEAMFDGCHLLRHLTGMRVERGQQQPRLRDRNILIHTRILSPHSLKIYIYQKMSLFITSHVWCQRYLRSFTPSELACDTTYKIGAAPL